MIYTHAEELAVPECAHRLMLPPLTSEWNSASQSWRIHYPAQKAIGAHQTAGCGKSLLRH